MEGPADFVARPTVRSPRARLAHPEAAGLIDHREHAESLQRPGARHLQEATPGGRARHMAADVARGFLVAEGLRVTIEVCGLRNAQEQSRAFQFHGQNALMPVSSRPITSWRSEEHTSELQSLMRISYAVFCLKKNKK